MIASVVVAIVPIALLIAAGFGLRRAGFLAESFWPQAERLCYFVLLPSLFVHSLAMADLGSVPVARIAAVLVAATLVVAMLLVVLRPLIAVDDAAFTSVFQGGVRFNNYAGVTLAATLVGPSGLALAAVTSAILVPLVNVLSVLAFARYGAARPTVRGVARQVALNPLVVGCVVGGAFQLAAVRVPVGVDAALKALGQAALPLGLICVGAALQFGAVARGWQPIGLSSLAKFAAMPAATIAACAASGLDGPAAIVAIAFQTLPTASSSYILARQLGGDAPLMAAITAIQTILALAAIPLVLGAAV